MCLHPAVLERLAAVITEPEPPPVVSFDEWLAERLRLTSRCLHCDYCREDVTLVEARAAFAAHHCERPPVRSFAGAA